jgi:UDP-glucose 4-epimerase
MNRSVLVVGGAGYIGSHMVKLLARQGGFDITVFDNLSRGRREALTAGTFVQGDLLCPEGLQRLFRQNRFDAVLHFAALAYVGESVLTPRTYYENNVGGTLNLLHAMLDAGVDKLVFSSSCATYGLPQVIPILEENPQNPINPYGRGKLMVERILQDYAHAYGLRSCSLRYFNAAGCDPEGELGELHDPETHLIPLVLREALRVLQGGDPEVTTLNVYGDDFDTPDGTCIRDFVHVQDLCTAHLAAMDLLTGGASTGAEAYNLGNGSGFSVMEVIEACRRLTGADIRYQIAGRRPGDPPRLVGGSARARDILGWRPEFAELDQIIETAWRWMKDRGAAL